MNFCSFLENIIVIYFEFVAALVRHAGEHGRKYRYLTGFRCLFEFVSTSMQGVGMSSSPKTRLDISVTTPPLVPRYSFYPGHYFIRNLGKGFCVHTL